MSGEDAPTFTVDRARTQLEDLLGLSLDWRVGPSASARALQVVVTSAIAAAALWGNGPASVGTGLWFVALAAGIAIVTRPRDVARWAALATAVVFAGFLAVRSTVWLVPLDFLAVFGLIAFAAVLPADRSILQRPVYVFARFFGLLRLGRAALYVVRPLAAALGSSDRSRVRGVLIGVGLAVPLVAVLAALLAAGDAVFGAALGQLAFGERLVVSGWYAALAAGITTTLLLATTRDWSGAGEPRRLLGGLEVSIVAGAVAVLYTAFAVTLAVATFGGADEVLDTAGLTRAEYARDGFFQLLWASGVTLAALLGLDRLRRRGPDVAFRIAAVVTSALTLLVVAVSISRLLTYVDDFGWTMLRLYTVLFAAWIGLLFLGLALRFAGVGVMVRGYPVFVAVTGLLWLLGLNVLNPEAFVVRENLARAGYDDAEYLSSLSDDATPAIIGALDELEPAEAEWLVAHLCRTTADEPVLGSVSAHRAFDALEPYC